MYNPYNLEPDTSKDCIGKFKASLLSEKISKGSVRSYLSDVRHFLAWLAEFLEKNHFVPQPPAMKQWNNETVILLSYVSPKLLEAYQTYQLDNNIPIRTINRRFSSLRKFGIFCQSQGWLGDPERSRRMNPFDTLRNIPEETKPFPENEHHLEEFKVHLWKNKASKATIKNYLNDVRQFILWRDSQ